MINYPDGLVTVNLTAENFEETVWFYSEYLGFRLIYEQPQLDDAKVALLELKNNTGFRVSLTSKSRDFYARDSSHVLFNINIQGCEIVYTKMKEGGIFLIKDFTSLPYMNYFIFKDPSGNVIEISEFFPEMIDWDR